MTRINYRSVYIACTTVDINWRSSVLRVEGY